MKPERSHEKSEHTRQFIIEKVAPLFNRQGFAGTSLSDLTRETGLTKGALYGHFRSKDEMAAEAFKHNLSLIVRALSDDYFCTGSVRERLVMFKEAYEKLYPRIMEIGGCPVLNNAVDADDTHEELKALSVNTFKNAGKVLTGILREGVANGEFRSGIRPEAVSGVMLSLLEGSLMISKATGERRYFDDAITHIGLIIKDIMRKDP